MTTTKTSTSRATTTSTCRRSSSDPLTHRPAHRFTTVADGDLCVDLPPEELAPRRRAIVDLPWTWLRQVHGGHVVRVEVPGEHAGVEADAAVTATPGAVLAVHTADCAPILLFGEGRVPCVGAVHAGWRGIVAGVIPAAVEALRALGAEEIHAHVGPMIGPECYEFGEADLERVARALGGDVRGETSAGAPALDLRRAVERALTAAGVEDVDVDPRCTACDPGLHSHRARGDRGRQAGVVWLP